MIYMILLGIIVICVYAFIAYKQKAIVNGLTLTAASMVIFNVIFPILYEVYYKSNINYIYILIYYCTSFVSLSVGYYLLNKSNKFELNVFTNVKEDDVKKFNFLIFLLIVVICLVLLKLIPKEYLKNPRVLYEKTRLGFGPIYFGITTLINIYFIFAMFIKKKYYYIIFSMILLYFTGSKARMLLPIEMFFLFYFYVKSNNRKDIKKIIIFGIGLIALFIGSYIVTSRYLPNKNIGTILRGLAGYSDYNRNFSILVNDLVKSKDYFLGQVTFENNFYSFIPRAIFHNKPTIFGSFRISYKFFPEGTILFQGAPSFGQFGAVFADFGHFSLIIIAIYNFVMGGLLALSEKNFIKNKNPFTFMLFIIFAGIILFDLGISAASIVVVNILMVVIIYYGIRILSKLPNKWFFFTFKKNR